MFLHKSIHGQHSVRCRRQVRVNQSCGLDRLYRLPNKVTCVWIKTLFFCDDFTGEFDLKQIKRLKLMIFGFYTRRLLRGKNKTTERRVAVVFTSIGFNKNLLDGFRTLDVGYWRLVLSMSLLVQIYYAREPWTRAVLPDFRSSVFTAALVCLRHPS